MLYTANGQRGDVKITNFSEALDTLNTNCDESTNWGYEIIDACETHKFMIRTTFYDINKIIINIFEDIDEFCEILKCLYNMKQKLRTSEIVLK